MVLLHRRKDVRGYDNLFRSRHSLDVLEFGKLFIIGKNVLISSNGVGFTCFFFSVFNMKVKVLTSTN